MSAPHLQPPCKAAPSAGGSGARAAPGAAQRGPYSGSAAGVRWRGAQLYFYSLVSALINIPSHGSRGPGQNRREPRRGQAWRQMSPRHAWARRLPAAPLLGEQAPASPRPAASQRAGGEGSRGRPRLAAINKSKKPACLGLTRKCKLETISCRSRSPDTLRRAAGSGGEVAIPSNTSYTKHEAAWGPGAVTVCQGLLQVSACSLHAAACSRPGLPGSLEICREAPGWGWGGSRRSDSPTAREGPCCETCGREHPAPHLAQGILARASRGWLLRQRWGGPVPGHPKLAGWSRARLRAAA